MFYSVLPSETQGKQKSRNLTLILPDSKSSSLCTPLDEMSQWRRESNKMKEEKANCILMLAQSYSKGQPAICQASPTQRSRLGASPTIPSASRLSDVLLLRVLGKREWCGVAAHSPCPDAGNVQAGCQVRPNVTYLWPVCMLMARPRTQSIFPTPGTIA